MPARPPRSRVGPSESSTPGSAGSPPRVKPVDRRGSLAICSSRSGGGDPDRSYRSWVPAHGLRQIASPQPGTADYRWAIVPCRGDLPPRARVLTVGCSTSQARPRIACGVPSRGGCRRCHGSEPDTGMQDIRHITSVLTHRRSGRAIRPGAIAPGIPIPPGCPALALATGPSLGSCADSLRFCVALPAVNVPAS